MDLPDRGLKDQEGKGVTPFPFLISEEGIIRSIGKESRREHESLNKLPPSLTPLFNSDPLTRLAFDWNANSGAPGIIQHSLFRDYRLLAHELAHLKRKDIVWNWLSFLARGSFFFHPPVGSAERESRQLQEICCDQLTVQLTKVKV